MDIRQPSEKLAELGKQLIETEEKLAYLRASRVRIGYLASEHEKLSSGRTVHGQCERVPTKNQWAIPYDFLVVFFMPNCERFTDEQLRILMFHELLHIGVERDGNDEQYRIIPHDIEDFKEIINRYGLEWSHDKT